MLSRGGALPLIVTLTLTLTVLHSAVAASRYHAALCITKAVACSKTTARRTAGYCKPRVDALAQPMKCRKLACSWCDSPDGAGSAVCQVQPLRWMCAKLRRSPSPSRKPKPSRRPKPSRSPKARPSKSAQPESPSRSPNNPDAKPSPTKPPPLPTPGACPRNRPRAQKNCVWRANSDPLKWRDGREIVIDFGLYSHALPDGWTCRKRGRWIGAVYEKDKNLGIDPKGKRGVKCFRVLPKHSGKYFFAALSYAPHHTEHNDMWVQSPDYGFELWRRGVLWRKAPKTEWLKAYQNRGPEAFIDQLKNKDFDGHRFLIPNVQKGTPFSVCIAGRSYRYELYRLYLIRCHGEHCEGRPYHDLQNRAVTQCKRLT